MFEMKSGRVCHFAAVRVCEGERVTLIWKKKQKKTRQTYDKAVPNMTEPEQDFFLTLGKVRFLLR